ncbi:unnamed protein product [Rhizophagus irregularis]|nr:unnamed protein product [Rhizophagus irregularis]
MLLLESSIEVAHKIYMDNTKLQGRSDAKAGINSKATKSHHRPNKARKGGGQEQEREHAKKFKKRQAIFKKGKIEADLGDTSFSGRSQKQGERKIT